MSSSSDKMISHVAVNVNGESKVPPGFRFHPTEEELLRYYLMKKVAYEKIDLDVIRDVDLNKLEPWDIQETCRIGSMPQNDWYFFSHKDKKYPTGTRTNRATAAGFWKATGRDKVIYSNSKRIGMRKTLVFYRGRAPHGQKSDWIMHEYRLDYSPNEASASNMGEISAQEDGWVVCRVFKKKNYHKALEGTQVAAASTSLMDTTNSSNDGVLNQILAYMGRSSCKETNMTTSMSKNEDLRFVNQLIINNEPGANKFMHLPGLENTATIPSLGSSFRQDCCLNATAWEQSVDSTMVVAEKHHEACCTTKSVDYPKMTTSTATSSGLSDWVAYDRLVACQLNGQVEASKQLPNYYGDHDDDEMFSFPMDHHDTQLTNPCYNKPNQSSQVCNSEVDIWSFARSSSSSSDPLGHLSM